MLRRSLVVLCVAAMVATGLPAAAVAEPAERPDSPTEVVTEEERQRIADREDERENASSRDEARFDADAEVAEDDREMLAQGLLADDAAGTYIVQFASPAVPAHVDALEARAPDGGLDVDHPTVRAYRQQLEAERRDGLVAIEAELARDVEVVASYDLAINGVSMELTPDEAARLAMVPEVAHIEREQIYELHTDAGPQHIGAETIWDGAFTGADGEYRGEGVVVGILDTGISPENPSFAAIGPVDGYEHSWDGDYFGACDPDSGQYEANFPCNDKLIGAWGFPAGVGARDGQDHGSHTASTAAGNVVDAELDGLPEGETLRISGVAPRAHIISYAVCTPGCGGANILSGINQAIADGVDVINYSIGSTIPSNNLWTDAHNVAWLNANSAGIRIAHSAGNSGPGDATVGSSSDLPWVTSVGASEHNRAIQNTLIEITGDDGATMDDIVGKGFTGALEAGTPVVYDLANPYCYAGIWGPNTFDGEIVLCDRGGPTPIARVASSQNVANAGGAGFALMNGQHQADTMHADEFVIPGVHISYANGEALKAFLAANDEVTAGVAGYEFNLDSPWTDQQSSFSSRGPNGATHSLVPSITAPGVDIIAAYGSFTGGEFPIEWGVMSGTSMSSPHVAGAYALLAHARPEWSHAQTQSAAQLTARPDTPKEDGSLGDPHSEGSGYINLDEAADAGFVLDITEDDYWAANPADGGDVRQLNAAELVNYDLGHSYTWNRTLSSTQDESVTWDVSYEAGPGISLDGPQTVTIDAGADADLAVTVTVDDDTAIGEMIYGRVTFTAGGDLPDAHMPVAVITTEPSSDLTVDPNEISALQEPGEVTSHTVTVGNLGNDQLSWSVTGEGSGAIWHQPIDGTSGIVSDYFIGEADAGVYAADDFVVADGTGLDSIFVPGFWAPQFPGSITEAEALTWFVYPDADGVPAGHPEDGEDNHVWTFSSTPGADGITIVDDDVTLNIAAAGADPLVLDGGTYWLVFYPDVQQNPESLNDRWNWYNGTSQLESAQLVDPAGLFGPGPGTWQPFADLGINWSGLAFTLNGEFACSMPDDVDWLTVDPTSGALGPNESQEVDVTFDATGMDVGTYTATLCIASDQPGAPTSSVTLTMDVVTYGSVAGTVTAADSGDPIEGATVGVVGTDISTTTDADGDYHLADVPSGERTVVANAGGYAAAEQVVVVEEGETATADFALELLPPMIGIAGDNGGELAGFLDAFGMPNMPFTWDDDVSDFSAIVINRAGDPGEDAFLAFLDAADAAGTGLVLLDTWSTLGNGVQLLHNHLGNPAARGTGFNHGALSYQVTAEHPIVDGYAVDDEIVFDVTSGDHDYAWFDGYTGDDVTLIADAVAGGETRGRGIAAEDRGTSRHALLSMHGASTWAGPEYWEAGGQQVFLNALAWVSDRIDVPEPDLVAVEVTPDEADIDEGESVQLSATAVYSNFPDVDVTDEADWSSSDEDVATVEAGEVTGIADGVAEITATFDGESGTSTVTVHAIVLPPEISVDPGSFDVSVPQGLTVEEALTIGNLGDEVLEWSITTAEAEAAVSRVVGEATSVGSADAPGSTSIGDVELATRDLAGDEPQTFANEQPLSTGEGVTLTHSTSQDIVELNSVACGGDLNTSANSYLRTFTLDDFDITSDFDVQEVSFGVETLFGTSHTVDVNLYLLDGDELVFGNLTEIGSADVDLDPQDGTIVTVPVDGEVPAGSTLVVEVFTPDIEALFAGIYIGSNDAGQTAPSYLAAASCGITEPTDTAVIGFPDMHIVMNVTGVVSEPGPCATPSDVPWLSVDPATGSTDAGMTDEVTVSFDSSDLDVGTYEAILCVASNDPGTPMVEIPVSLTVTDPVVVSVDVTPAEVEVHVQRTAQLTATAVWSNGDEVDVTSEAAWASDDERTVSVTDTGLVRGLRFGSAEVTAEYDGVTGSATVTVPRRGIGPPGGGGPPGR